MEQKFETIDEYINSFDENVQILLKKIHNLIKEIAPESKESISYGMPAYKLNKKPLVYFGAFKNHIGFYATPSGHEKLEKELSEYKQGKGSVQFPFDKPLPLSLISKIVKFRLSENLKKETL
ncbi:MAG: iron chaperone [Candidatus Sericytochromatia bacterium]